MTANQAPGRFSRIGLQRALSPEIVATVLAVFVGIGGIIAISSGSPGGVAPTPGPPSPDTAAATATATATATPSLVVPTLAIATASPTPPATPIPPSASVPVWATSAKALIAADIRLIEWREALRTELARKPQRSDELARLLRATNLAIHVASDSLESLQDPEAPRAAVETLRTAHQSALEAGLRTLAIALQDVSAYRRGTAEVIAALEPLEGGLQALAASAGLPDPLPELRSSPTPSTSPVP